MGLDNDFFFSSTIVSKIVKSANEIRGLKLSDLIIAFFEIFCEFNVQMNKDIFAFYCLFMSDLSFNYRDRFVELDILENWGNPTHSNTTVTFFKFFLIDDNSPEFVIETMCILIDNECFDDFLHLMGYLFNDSYYKSEFKKTLTKSNITIELKNRIASLSVLD